MKKNYLLTLLCLISFSCTNEEPFWKENSSNSNDSNQEIHLRPITNGPYNVLGYAYDVTGEYLGPYEAKFAVIDIDAFKRDHSGYLYTNDIGFTKNEYYSGATAKDFVKEIESKTNYHNSISIFDGSDKDKNEIFTGNITQKGEYKDKYTYSSKYAFSRADVKKTIRRVYMDTDVTTLSRYLTENFKTDVDKLIAGRLSADSFVSKYGTHVLTDITIGGRLNFLYRSTIVSEENYSKKKNIVESGLKVFLNHLKLENTTTIEGESITSLNEKNASWQCKIESYGGTYSGIGQTSFSSETGYPSISINTGEWEKTIQTENAALTDINWEKAYPIYEFISNSSIKTKVKVAVRNYIQSKKLEVKELLPLYRLYRSEGQNSFYTTSWAEVDMYIRKYNYYLDNVQTQYVQGYVFKNQEPGTLPLYRLYHATARNSFYTTSLAEANTYINQWGYYFDDVITGRIQGYVYPTQKDNTVALYRLYHSGAQNSFLTSSLEEANTYIYQWGYYVDSPQKEYAYLFPYGNK